MDRFFNSPTVTYYLQLTDFFTIHVAEAPGNSAAACALGKNGARFPPFCAVGPRDAAGISASQTLDMHLCCSIRFEARGGRAARFATRFDTRLPPCPASLYPVMQ